MANLTKNVKGFAELTLDGLDLIQKINAGKIPESRLLCEKIMKKIQSIQDELAKIHAELTDADEAANMNGISSNEVGVKCNRIDV